MGQRANIQSLCFNSKANNISNQAQRQQKRWQQQSKYAAITLLSYEFKNRKAHTHTSKTLNDLRGKSFRSSSASKNGSRKSIKETNGIGGKKKIKKTRWWNEMMLNKSEKKYWKKCAAVHSCSKNRRDHKNRCTAFNNSPP